MLPVFGSDTLLGAITFAVLLSVPVADDTISHIAVNVAVPLIGNDVIATLMLPEPDCDAHTAPLEPAHVHVQPVIVAANVSVTVAPSAAFGPLLVATIVYVTGPPIREKKPLTLQQKPIINSRKPGVAVVEPSVFEIDKSADGVAQQNALPMLMQLKLPPVLVKTKPQLFENPRPPTTQGPS